MSHSKSARPASQNARFALGGSAATLTRGQVDGESTPGAIVLIGGLPTDKDEPEQLHRLALSLARRTRRVAIVGAAGNDSRAITELIRHYTLLGASASDAGLYTRADAERAETLNRLKRADLIYFAGGASRQLIEAVRGTTAWDYIVDAWQGGTVLVGASAGCDCLGAVVVSPTAGPAGRRGLGVLPDTVLAGHFREWQRGSNLAATLTVHPSCVGVGIDENTAAVLHPGASALEVTGEGTVSLWIKGERRQQAAAGEQMPLPGWNRVWQAYS